MKPETITLAVTRPQMEMARARLGECGLPIAGDSGQQEKDGYRVGYSFDEAAGKLTLQLLKKPFYVPVSLIRGKVLQALASEGIREA